MYENFGNFLLIIFTISKIDFTIKKQILGRKLGNLEWEDGNSGISSETTETRESRVRRQPVCGDPPSATQPDLARPTRTWHDSPGATHQIDGSSHSRFPGFRRLTRDSRISGLFFVKSLEKSGKIWKISFLDSWGQNKILKFLDFYKIFIYGWYFLYKPLFPSS